MWRVFCTLAAVATSFYLPGVTLKKFDAGGQLEIVVDKLDSAKTQLPFEYYYLNYCQPSSITSKHENLGQILQGDRMETSAYTLTMKKDSVCVPLCVRNNTEEQVDNFRWMIDNEYKASWVLDNLPAGIRFVTKYSTSYMRWSYYDDGFPIGYKYQDNYYIYNHMHIVVKVNKVTETTPEQWVIVGFLVSPMSIDGEETCSSSAFKKIMKEVEKAEEKVGRPEYNNTSTGLSLKPLLLSSQVNFTYSVSFEESDVHWSNRWNYYFETGGSEENEVHWLSIINSFAMVLFLSGMVAHILGRTLRKDISIYNERTDMEETEDTGWKQVHGDVFRPPFYQSVFSVLVGSGVQLIGMTILTLFFASLGFLSPAHRGGLLTTMMLLFVFMGVFAGYSSARLYKFFGGVHWKTNTVATAVFLPGSCFSMFFVINLFVWAEESSGAVPFLHLLSILVLWLGISVPLVFLGSAIGHKKESLTSPCAISRIPRPLNMIHGAGRLRFICILAGSLPFGCMFIELSYVMKSLWHHTLFYYLFGFLFLCFFVLIVTSAEVSILMTYILLNR